MLYLRISERILCLKLHFVHLAAEKSLTSYWPVQNNCDCLKRETGRARKFLQNYMFLCNEKQHVCSAQQHQCTALL